MIVYKKSKERVDNFNKTKQIFNDLEMFDAIDGINMYNKYKQYALENNFVNDYCIKIYNCLTTTGYIVKKKYYATLLNNYKEGLRNLMRDQTNPSFKIDKYWQILQNKDNWYMLIPPTIIQKEDYSDIEKKVTNFRNYMLDFNKAIRK
jgi:hypothetical protein